jgi:diguanylate cyclase (GGDEF)-like protein
VAIDGDPMLELQQANFTPARGNREQRAQLAWLVVNLVFNVIAIAVDRVAILEHFQVALTARTIVTGLFLAGITLHALEAPPQLRSFVTGLTTVVFVAVIAGLAQFANDAFSSRYLMVATFVLFTTALFSGMRWPATVVTVSFAWLLLSCLAAFNVHYEIVATNLDLIFLSGSTAGVALVLRWRQDRQRLKIKALYQRDRIRLKELRDANAKLELLSHTDSLTGLYNRRYLDTMIDGLEHALVPVSSVGLLMIDIDHFKTLNDRHGHPEGDRCLRTVAQTILTVLGETDATAVRFGGEEFLVVLRDASKDHVLEIADKVRQSVADLALPNEGAGSCDIVTVSVGAYFAPVTGPMIEAIDQADKLLYEAKMRGRNCVCYSEDSELTHLA